MHVYVGGRVLTDVGVPTCDSIWEGNHSTHDNFYLLIPIGCRVLTKAEQTVGLGS